MRHLLAVVTFCSLLAPSSLSAQEPVSFPSPDSGVVYGEVRGSGNHIVVFAHGGQFSKESWADQAQDLADRGFRTLTIDMRGRGLSQGGPGNETNTDLWHLDVIGAVRYAQSIGPNRISLVGASWGGWAAARASAELGPDVISSIVLMAHSSVDNPEQIQGRKLFITTRDDFMGSGTRRLPAIRDQFERASEPKELVILEGSAHAQHVFATDVGPRFWSEIVRFLGNPTR